MADVMNEGATDGETTTEKKPSTVNLLHCGRHVVVAFRLFGELRLLDQLSPVDGRHDRDGNDDQLRWRRGQTSSPGGASSYEGRETERQTPKTRSGLT